MLHASRWKCRTPKIRHLRTIAQRCWAVFSQLRQLSRSTIGKNLLNSNTFSTFSHSMVNFGPLMAEIGSLVWDTQQISTCFASWRHYCTDIAQWRSSKLCMMFGHLLGWYTTYTLVGSLAHNGILTGAKFTLRPNLAFFYSSVTARHLNNVYQPNCVAFSRG